MNLRFALITATTLLLGAPALAQLPNVAICAAADDDPADCRFTDVRDYLLASNKFSGVTVVDCVLSTPTSADLMVFDGILTFSNVNYFDSVALGDAFADYVDAGGGVVVAVFGSTSSTPARALQGRWLSGNFGVIQQQLGGISGAASLGAVLVPGHPTMAGVSTLAASSAFRPRLTTPLIQGSVISQWNDGATLVAVGASPNRIDLGLYPPSSNCSSAFWDVSGDGDTLIANSLEFVALNGIGGIGTNYCTAVPNTTGSPSTMSAAGMDTAADNNVTLVASGLPPNQFGIFLVSAATSFVPGAGGTSNGNLCLGGQIGRYNQAGQILGTGTTGEFSLHINVTTIPQGNGFTAVMPGDNWSFQAWHRSGVGLGSNFSDGLTITFQ